MSGQWRDSNRASRLPADWRARVIATRERAGGQCEWIEESIRCLMPGNECDHVDGDDNHDRLQWLCTAHHRMKTQAEAAAALRKRAAISRHPREKHPGIVG